MECIARAVIDLESLDYDVQNALLINPYTVVFRSNRQSRVTHPPVDSEIWLGSRVALAIVEPP